VIYKILINHIYRACPLLMITPHMNPTTVDMHMIAALGSAIYGKWWRRHVARDLGVHSCTVGRWMRGIGAPEMKDLYRLLAIARKRYEALLEAHEVGRQALRLPAPRPELSPPRPASTWPSKPARAVPRPPVGGPPLPSCKAVR